MPRTLRFRAWDTIEKQMKEVAMLRFENGQDISRVAAYKNDGQHNGWTDDVPGGRFVLMQSTGLTDRNGKEIFEFDYLGSWFVVWGSGKYILHDISNGDIIDCVENTTYDKEITGNKFETPREHPCMASDI